VVVIGGGVIGACCALHLREAGVRRVTVLDAGAMLGSQTTAAGAGFAAYWAGSLEGSLADYAVDFYARLQEESGRNLGIRRSGLLLPALSERGLEVVRGLYEHERSFSEHVEMLDGPAAEALSPLLAQSKVRAAVLQTNAHRVPTGAMMGALARRLDAAGVDVRAGVRAVRAVTSRERVTGVETDASTIACGAVVNAAGAWAHALGARNGVTVGAVPLLESRYVTEPSPVVSDDAPMLLFLERNALYVRPERGGLLVGAIESAVEAASRVDLHDPPDAAALPRHAVEHHERLARRSADVVPLLGELATAARASGMPTFTPDGRHVLGEAPGLSGYHVVAGCNESGVTHAPGLARLLAATMTGSDAGADLSPYRVGRFDGMTDAQLGDAAAATYLRRLV